jgi:hypothetical protein
MVACDIVARIGGLLDVIVAIAVLQMIGFRIRVVFVITQFPCFPIKAHR